MARERERLGDVSFGEKLRQLREAARLTQEQLAERAGLTAKGIGALERGERQRPYQHTMQALAEALDLSDMERDALFASVPSRGGPAPIERSPRPTNRLPVPPTPMIGREQEIVEVGRLLKETPARLLTLTGPGGVGKSRLAIQVASEAEPYFPDGVLFVALASIQNPTLVLPTIATAIDLREAGSRPIHDVLQSHLQNKQMLLVLDNFEHVADAATEVATLLATCPHLSLLVTSRAPLHLRGEQEYPVEPLPVPSLERIPTIDEVQASPAAQLFLERAQATAPSFCLTQANAAAIAAICRRLDGLPLALELAAARIKLLPPLALLGRLDRGLPLLAWGARDLPERQQTMRHTVAWSYNLLTPEEQRLLRRLSAFVGGWTLEAAEAICTASDNPLDVFEGMISLQDKSLVVRHDDGDGAESRFGMLETIRQFARDELLESGEYETMRQRHLAFYLVYVERRAALFRGPQMLEAFEALEMENDNLRAALEWSLERDPDAALKLAGILGPFWYRRGYLTEGRRWLRDVAMQAEHLSLPQRMAARANVLTQLGRLAIAQGDYAVAHTQLQNAAVLGRQADDQRPLASALSSLALTTMSLGDLELAHVHAMECEVICRREGYQWEHACGLCILAEITFKLGDPSQACTYVEESLRLAENVQNPWLSAFVRFALGTLATLRSEPGEAQQWFEESMTLFGKLQDLRHEMVAHSELAHLMRREAAYEEALSLYRKSIVTWLELGHQMAVIHQLECLAYIADAEGEVQHAARLLGAAERLRATNNSTRATVEQQEYEKALASVRAQCDEREWHKAWAEGQAMTLQQAVDYALEYNE